MLNYNQDGMLFHGFINHFKVKYEWYISYKLMDLDWDYNVVLITCSLWFWCSRVWEFEKFIVRLCFYSKGRFCSKGILLVYLLENLEGLWIQGMKDLKFCNILWFDIYMASLDIGVLTPYSSNDHFSTT